MVTIDRERLIRGKQNNQASAEGSRLPKEAMPLKDIFNVEHHVNTQVDENFLIKMHDSKKRTKSDKKRTKPYTVYSNLCNALSNFIDGFVRLDFIKAGDL